jgi:hypothetical protein
MLLTGQMNRAAQLRDMLERALLFDSWGQMLEAATEYEAIAKSTKQWLESQPQPSEGIPGKIFMNLQPCRGPELDR